MSGVADWSGQLSTGSLNPEENKEAHRPFSDNAPSWEELGKMVQQKGLEIGDPSLTQDDYSEVGPPSADSVKRTFGKTEPIRVKLYRDRAAWCPFCQTVWMQLEEKKIPYTVEYVNMNVYGDKSESFLQINPSGQVPLVELDGKVIVESAVIAEALEENFPENPLVPDKESEEFAKYNANRELMKQLSPAIFTWLRASEPAPQERAEVESLLQQLESQLSESGGPFVLGSNFSMADIKATPFLERHAASLTYFKGFIMRGNGQYPALEKWYEAMESRPAYIATKSDYYTYVHILPVLAPLEVSSDAKPFAEKIDGISNGSWKLPLEPLSSTSTEPYSLGDNPAIDTYYAAKKLITNHEAVVMFALRACGKKGEREQRTAPLSDPTAEPGMHAFSSADTALRHVAHALLITPDEKQANSSKLMSASASGKTSLSCEEATSSLKYLRDRVGVPRDLKLPEARQLRAHLNWGIEQLM